MSTEISAPEEASVAKPAVEVVESEEWPELEPLTRESRFLFVDVASRRAKQLRRGALPRLAALAPHPETGERPTPAAKLERIAMEEVDKGLILYALPEPREPETEES